MRVLQLKIDMKKKEFQQQEEKNKMLMAKAGEVPYEYYNWKRIWTKGISTIRRKEQNDIGHIKAGETMKAKSLNESKERVERQRVGVRSNNIQI